VWLLKQKKSALKEKNTGYIARYMAIMAWASSSIVGIATPIAGSTVHCCGHVSEKFRVQFNNE
jgi:hypothetical protein